MRKMMLVAVSTLALGVSNALAEEAASTTAAPAAPPTTQSSPSTGSGPQGVSAADVVASSAERDSPDTVSPDAGQSAPMDAIKAMRESHRQRLRDLMEASRQTTDPAELDNLLDQHIQAMREEAQKMRALHMSAVEQGRGRPARRATPAWVQERRQQMSEDMPGGSQGMMPGAPAMDEFQPRQGYGPRWGGGRYGGMSQEEYQPGQGFSRRWGGMSPAQAQEDVQPGRGYGPRWGGGPHGGMPAAQAPEDVPPGFGRMPRREDMIERQIQRMEALIGELREMQEQSGPDGQ